LTCERSAEVDFLSENANPSAVGSQSRPTPTTKGDKGPFTAYYIPRETLKLLADHFGERIDGQVALVHFYEGR
jgi:hypothetical protein